MPQPSAAPVRRNAKAPKRVVSADIQVDEDISEAQACALLIEMLCERYPDQHDASIFFYDHNVLSSSKSSSSFIEVCDHPADGEDSDSGSEMETLE